VAIKGSVKQWNPSSRKSRAGNALRQCEANFETVLDRASRVGRTDWEKKFAYPRAAHLQVHRDPHAGRGFMCSASTRRHAMRELADESAGARDVELAARYRAARASAAPRSTAWCSRCAAILIGCSRTRYRGRQPLVSGGCVPKLHVAFDPQTGLPGTRATLDLRQRVGRRQLRPGL